MNMQSILDAPQRALAFVMAQGARIESEVYRVRYREIQYSQLVPVDTQGPEWVQSVIYTSMDQVGQAKWINGRAYDIPKAEVIREKFTVAVQMAGVGYGWDIEEIGQALLLGLSLANDKAAAARRTAEEHIDRVAMFGDASKSLTGLANNASVTAGSAAATGTGSSTAWADKTPDNVLADVNSALTGMFTGTLGAEIADTLLLPYTQIQAISTRRIDATNQTTILEWIERNNVYTRTTGAALTLRGVWGLETAGASSATRMIAYRRAPDVLKMYMPMAFRFLPAWQVGPMQFDVPGIFRLGGVDVKRPKAMRYMDGI